MLSLTVGEQPFLIMGLPIYMDYFTVHDDIGGQIGFVPRKGSAKNGPFWGTIPSRDLDLNSSEVVWDLDLVDDEPMPADTTLSPDGTEFGPSQNGESDPPSNEDRNQMVLWVMLSSLFIVCTIIVILAVWPDSVATKRSSAKNTTQIRTILM